MKKSYIRNYLVIVLFMCLFVMIGCTSKEEVKRQAILALDKELSDVIKDIEYQKETQFPQNLEYFMKNQTFLELATKLLELNAGNFQDSPSQIIQKEYARISKLQLEDSSSLIEFWVEGDESIDDDRKGTGRKFEIKYKKNTLLPISVKINYNIYAKYQDKVHSDYAVYNSGEELLEGPITNDNIFDCNAYESTLGYINIWDRARGESISGYEFTKMTEKKYDGSFVEWNYNDNIYRYANGWIMKDIAIENFTILN